MSDDAPKKPVKLNKPGAGTVFDVSRPGRATVSSTSKPVIVGHKPQVRDPLTTGRTNDERPLLSTRQKVDIRPTHEDEPKEQETSGATPELAAIAAELAAQPEQQSPTPVPATVQLEPEGAVPEVHEDPKPPTAPVAEEAPARKVVEETGPSSAAIPASTPEPVMATPVPLSPELKRELEAAVHDDAMAAPASHDVIVSGGHRAMSVWKVLMWLVTVVVLVVVIGDVLLDAGTITTSVSIPHTHFIK